MLVRPINLSLYYYVKDNVVLQALCPSSNCLHTIAKSKSTMLRHLKGELGYVKLLLKLPWLFIIELT